MIAGKKTDRLTAILAAVAMVLSLLFLPAYAEEENDLTPYITGGAIYYRPAGDPEWTEAIPDADGQYNVPADADYQIALNYRIPEKTLSDEFHTLTYQLPAGIKVYPESGPILQGSTLMGSFTITEDGRVTLDFNDTAIALNASGPISDGTIKYDVDLRASGAKDENGDIPIDIGPAHLIVHLKVEPDLEIVKKGSTDGKGHEITYSITVSSENGTDGQPVSVSDQRLPGNDGMISLDEAENLQICDNAGQQIEGWTLQKSEDGFTIDGLPPLKAKESYTITYTAKMHLTNGKEVEAINQASASSGKLLTEPSKCVFTYKPEDLISKSGQLEADGQIRWTITINKNNNDISGWTLSDRFNHAEMENDVTISPAIDGQSSIRLPFTFPQNSTGTYQVTYLSPASGVDGENRAVNEVILTPPENKEPARAEAQVDLGNEGINNSAEKKFVKARKEADGTETLTWNLKMAAGDQGFGSEFIISDDCGEKGMYITADQLNSLYDELSGQLASYGISIEMMMAASPDGVLEYYPDFSAQTHYTVFDIEMSGGLKKGESLDLDYQTIVDTSDLVKTTEFLNTASVTTRNETMKRTARWTFRDPLPWLRKLDERARNEGKLTKHDFDEVKGILKWDLVLGIPEGFNPEDTVITEELPEGVNLEEGPDGTKIDSPVTVRVWKSRYILPLDGSQTDGISANISTENGSQQITIVFSKSFFQAHPKLRRADIDIEAGVNQEPDWKFENGEASVPFENNASLKVGEKQRGSVRQTQKLTKNIDISALKKEISADTQPGSAFTDNTIPYTISVNPKAQQLCPGAQKLIIDDIASVTCDEKECATLELINGSVTITEIKNGQKVPLKSDEYSYVFSSHNNGSGKMEYEIKFTVPDQMALQISYDYLINGKMNSEYTISNTAKLSCEKQGQMQSDTKAKSRIISAQATVEEIGVTVYKTDKDNSMDQLPGARFELEEYNSSTQHFEPVMENGKPKLFTTDQLGTVCISSPWVSFGKAYELKEVRAPDNYILNDEPVPFIILDNSQKEVDAPEGFMKTAHIFNMCGDLYIGNEKAVKEIPVSKVWVDENNNPCEPLVGKITAALYKKEKNGSLVLADQIVLSGENNWQGTFSDLPVYEMKIQDGKETVDFDHKIDYSIKEMTEDTRWNSSIASNEDGSFTITNTKKPVPVHLPDTGSSGWIACILSAFCLFILGIGIRKVSKDNPEL